MLAVSTGSFLFFSGQSAVPVRGMTGSQTPRRPVAHCESPRQEKSTAGKKSRAHGEARRGSRLASGGAEKVSARTSLRSSAAPSTLAAFPSGREGRLAATARAAANEGKADQRET